MDELSKEKYVVILTQKYVKKITEIWRRVYDQSHYMENLDKLAEHATNFYKDLVNESIEKEEYMKHEIDEYRREAENLKRLLKVDFELQIHATDKPLLVVQAELDSSLEKLRECLRQRREQIYELLLEQESLCDELGNPPRPLLADPLPTAEEIEEFRRHLQRLKDERVQRLHELSTLRREIKGYLQVLELQVTTETEDRLLNHRQIKLNKDTFTGLQRMHKCYGQQVQEVHDKIDEMREKLETLWERLDTSLSTRDKFRKYTEYTQSTYDFYYGELQRCQALKSQNIEFYVKQIREEIVNWWNKTLKSEQERNIVKNFNSNCYTDDLLMLHEMELEDLKSYYENNKDIFELFAERKILWERMNALEAKASEPGRYNNRGGQLLKEEKERKVIACKLPKIEQQITKLVRQYEERERKRFFIYGENILDVMAKDQKNKLPAASKKISPKRPTKTVNRINKSVAPRAAVSAITLRRISPSSSTSTPQYAVQSFKRRKSIGTERLPTDNLHHPPHKRLETIGAPIIGSAARRQLKRLSGGSTQKRQLGYQENKPPPPKIIISTPNDTNAYETFESEVQKHNRSSVDLKRMHLAYSEDGANRKPLNAVLVNINRQSCSPSVSGGNSNKLKNSPIII